MRAKVAMVLMLAAVAPRLSDQPKTEVGLYSSKAVSLCVAPSAADRIVAVSSPDKAKTVIVDYTEFYENHDKPVTVYMEAYHNRFKVEAVYPLDPNMPWGPDAELLWAPDSRAFFVNYSDGGSVGTFHALVYFVGPSGVRRTEPTQGVREAYYSQPVACFAPGSTNQQARIGPPEKPNVGAVTWLGDSSKLIIAAEVPPHSSCDDMGTFRLYEVSVPSGRVLRSYGQIEAKKLFLRDVGEDLRNADDNCFLKPKSCWSPWLHPELKVDK